MLAFELRAPTLAVLAMLGAGACASQLPVPAAVDVRRAEALWPGTTQQDLADGRALYVGRCSSCHTLALPHEFKRSQWAEFVNEMADAANLDQSEREKITRYLVVMAPP
jgi:mono/diheme cytochrome c family protein